MMKLIVGLGNPGIKYVNNRHNAGFLVAEQLKSQISNFQPTKLAKLRLFPISNQLLIFKSKNFMNDSGSFVLKLTNRYCLNPSYLYIVHDDLDIPLGSFKIQFGKGPRGHNGILDIEEKLGTSEFWRVRVGVDNRLQVTGNRLQGEEYVLQNFTDDEKKILESVIKKICFELIEKLKIE